MTTGDSTHFILRILVYFASWLILLPHLPISAPKPFKMPISSLTLTTAIQIRCKIRPHIKSVFLIPNVFSSLRMTLYSSSVNRTSIFLFRLAQFFSGLPFLLQLSIIKKTSCEFSIPPDLSGGTERSLGQEATG